MARLIPNSFTKLASTGNKLAQKVREAANRGGDMLPPDLKHRLETSLHEKFEDVRIHENHKATLAGALAYSQGQDIFFAPGKFQPHTDSGFELLSHELAHVVQQKAGHNNVHVPKGMAQVLDTAELPELP